MISTADGGPSDRTETTLFQGTPIPTTTTSLEDTWDDEEAWPQRLLRSEESEKSLNEQVPICYEVDGATTRALASPNDTPASFQFELDMPTALSQPTSIHLDALANNSSRILEYSSLSVSSSGTSSHDENPQANCECYDGAESAPTSPNAGLSEDSEAENSMECLVSSSQSPVIVHASPSSDSSESTICVGNMSSDDVRETINCKSNDSEHDSRRNNDIAEASGCTTSDSEANATTQDPHPGPIIHPVAENGGMKTCAPQNDSVKSATATLPELETDMYVSQATTPGGRTTSTINETSRSNILFEEITDSYRLRQKNLLYEKISIGSEHLSPHREAEDKKDANRSLPPDSMSIIEYEDGCCTENALEEPYMPTGQKTTNLDYMITTSASPTFSRDGTSSSLGDTDLSPADFSDDGDEEPNRDVAIVVGLSQGPDEAIPSLSLGAVRALAQHHILDALKTEALTGNLGYASEVRESSSSSASSDTASDNDRQPWTLSVIEESVQNKSGTPHSGECITPEIQEVIITTELLSSGSSTDESRRLNSTPGFERQNCIREDQADAQETPLDRDPSPIEIAAPQLKSDQFSYSSVEHAPTPQTSPQRPPDSMVRPITIEPVARILRTPPFLYSYADPVRADIRKSPLASPATPRVGHIFIPTLNLVDCGPQRPAPPAQSTPQYKLTGSPLERAHRIQLSSRSVVDRRPEEFVRPANTVRRVDNLRTLQATLPLAQPILMHTNTANWSRMIEAPPTNQTPNTIRLPLPNPAAQLPLPNSAAQCNSRPTLPSPIAIPNRNENRVMSECSALRLSPLSSTRLRQGGSGWQTDEQRSLHVETSADFTGQCQTSKLRRYNSQIHNWTDNKRRREVGFVEQTLQEKSLFSNKGEFFQFRETAFPCSSPLAHLRESVPKCSASPVRQQQVRAPQPLGESCSNLRQAPVDQQIAMHELPAVRDSSPPSDHSKATCVNAPAYRHRVDLPARQTSRIIRPISVAPPQPLPRPLNMKSNDEHQKYVSDHGAKCGPAPAPEGSTCIELRQNPATNPLIGFSGNRDASTAPLVQRPPVHELKKEGKPRPRSMEPHTPTIRSPPNIPSMIQSERAASAIWTAPHPYSYSSPIPELRRPVKKSWWSCCFQRIDN